MEVDDVDDVDEGCAKLLVVPTVLPAHPVATHRMRTASRRIMV